MSKKTFYRECYLKTGWLPMQPLSHHLAVGDVCQIRHGRFQALLNIKDAHLVEQVQTSPQIALAPIDWALSSGVQQSFSETQSVESADGEELQWTRQVLDFAYAESFMFHAHEPKAHLLLNWHQIRDDLTLKLTQLHYSFREVYVVTGVVKADDWGLAIAAQAGARLEMSTAISNTDSFSLLSHHSAKTDQSKGIASYATGQGQSAHFFKAKKLILSDAMYDRYLNLLLQNSEHLRPANVSNWLNNNLLNLVKANELNLNTSMGFFNWVDMSLDDVALLTG